MIKILRITTVSHSLDLLLKGQLRYMVDKGNEVHIACTYDDKVNFLEERECVKYHKLNLTRTINPFKDILALYNLINLIRKIKPDIVHSHSPKAGIVGMLAAFICKVPLKVHTVAGLPLVETRGVKKNVLLMVEKLTYFCADYVLPNSIKQKEFINEHILINDKIQVIGKGSSNGIDLKYFNPDNFNSKDNRLFREQYGIAPSDIVLCFVGRLTNYKGINELINAFCNLQEEFFNIKLFLVGPIEDINPLAVNTKDEIKNNTSIFSVGHQDDIRPFLAVSDIFVFPSYREGFPQSLMQAAAMNLPCIASDINGCNEIIQDGVNGILIPPKNTDAIVRVVKNMIYNEEFRLSLAKKARKNMLENFEQTDFWDKILAFYESKLKNK